MHLIRQVLEHGARLNAGEDAKIFRRHGFARRAHEPNEEQQLMLRNLHLRARNEKLLPLEVDSKGTELQNVRVMIAARGGNL